MIYKINETDNDSLVVTGGKLANDNFWVVKTDASGVLLWERTYGGSYYEYAFTQAVTHENNIIVAGKTTSTDGENKLGELRPIVGLALGPVASTEYALIDLRMAP